MAATKSTKIPEGYKELKITDVLIERGNNYGAFPEHARITQNIKRAMADSSNWNAITDTQKEALEMLAHKIGRILNGNVNYLDSWVDIVGYTQLVVDDMQKRQQEVVK